MRRRWPCIMGLVIAGPFSPTFAVAQPAHEGCAWRSGEILTVQGAVTEGGLEGSFTRIVEWGSGRFREHRDYGVMSTGAGNDGAHSWSEDVSGFAHLLDSEFAERLARSEAWLRGNQSCARAGGAHVEVLPPEVEGGRSFDVRRVTPSNGAPVEVWYDSVSGLPDRAILQYAENRLVRHYEDWRDVGGGRKVAFRQVDEDIEDESTTTFIVHEVKVGKPRERSLFGIPAAPQDVRFLGQGKASSVPYEDDHRTRIYIPVFLNGEGPFTFELDSGGHFILAPKTVAALGLSATGAFSSTGAGGEVSKAGYVRIDSVRIGTAEIVHQTAKVLPLRDSSNDRGSKPPRAGILGLELVERFRVRVDRTRQIVTLEAPRTTAPTPPWKALRITFDEDAPLVSGSFAGAGGVFMIDTGNAGATIIEQFWAEQAGVTRVFDAALSVGDVKLALAELAVGPFRLTDEIVSHYGVQPRGSEHTRTVAAVAGEPLLSRFDLTFDYAHQRLWMRRLDDRSAVPFNRSGLNLSKSSDGSFRVASVIAASPAADSGLTDGEIVGEVSGQPSSSLSRADVIALFQQPAGTSVEITLRDSAGRPGRSLTLRLRDVLPPSAVASGSWRNAPVSPLPENSVPGSR
jgi:hypothetical protein